MANLNFEQIFMVNKMAVRVFVYAKQLFYYDSLYRDMQISHYSGLCILSALFHICASCTVVNRR